MSDDNETPSAGEVIDSRPHHFTKGMRYDTYVVETGRMVLVNSLYYIQVDLETGDFMVRTHAEVNAGIKLLDERAAERKQIVFEALAKNGINLGEPKASPLHTVKPIVDFHLNSKGKAHDTNHPGGEGPGRADAPPAGGDSSAES